MGKSRKNKKIKTGGLLENYGLPGTTMLSQFAITDANLAQFNRRFTSPMDCFINALQIMGVLDDRSANIMRISTIGRVGFTKEQIEMIFSFTYLTNFDFKSTLDYDEWARWIHTYLTPGNVVFAGYTGHVFLIGRRTDRTIIYIDPQVGQFCNLDTPECQQYVRDKRQWYLLFNSTERLTPEQTGLITASVQHLQTNP